MSWLSGVRYVLAVAATLFVVAASADVSLAVSAPPPDHPLLGAITGENIGKEEQLKGACGVAVDSAKDVYVADYYQNRIVGFRVEEGQLKRFTQISDVDPLDAGGVAPLDGPCGLAIDA